MKKKEKFEPGTVQWLMMQAVKSAPEPYIANDFLIFKNATVRFEITVKITKEEFATNESHESINGENKQ